MSASQEFHLDEKGMVYCLNDRVYHKRCGASELIRSQANGSLLAVPCYGSTTLMGLLLDQRLQVIWRNLLERCSANGWW